MASPDGGRPLLSGMESRIIPVRQARPGVCRHEAQACPYPGVNVMAAKSKQRSDLFIVDNSDRAWNALRHLQEWTKVAGSFAIATGYFEIGSPLAMAGQGQGLGKLRTLVRAGVRADRGKDVTDATDF